MACQLVGRRLLRLLAPAEEGAQEGQRLQGSPSLLPPSQLASRLGLVWQLAGRRRLLQMPPSKEMLPPRAIGPIRSPGIVCRIN